MSYQPVERCIYCGAESPPPLSREHILAESLGGKLVLLRASCGRHRDITSKLELSVARQAYGEYRAAEGMPTKKPKNRVTHVTITAQLQDGSWEPRKLPIAEWPRTHIVAHYPPPLLLSRQAYDPTALGTLEPVRGDDEAYRRTMRKYGWLTFENHAGAFNALHFLRVLAKTAHAFATAEFGYGNFQPLLLPLIDGETNEPTHYSQFVGGFEPRLPQQVNALSYRIEPIGARQYIVVTISFHAFKSFPAYQVVAGQW